MTAALRDMSDADVVTAIEANTQAAFARWAMGLGAGIQSEPDTVCSRADRARVRPPRRPPRRGRLAARAEASERAIRCRWGWG